MTELLIVLGVMFGFYAFGWIIEQISDARERERSRQRDEIAAEVFNEFNIINDDFKRLEAGVAYLRDSLPQRLVNTEPVELEMPSGIRTRQGQICRKCNMGVLVPRRGPYGQFLGCSMYPICKNKKPMNWVDTRIKEDHKNRFEKQFLNDLKKAYD